MAFFVPNNWKGHLGISVSELYFKNALGLLINNRSNFRSESLSKANYHSKNRVDQNNRCHKNAGKFRRNIISTKFL